MSSVKPAKALLSTLAMLIIAVPNRVGECEDEGEKPVVTMNKNLLNMQLACDLDRGLRVRRNQNTLRDSCFLVRHFIKKLQLY